MIRLNGGKGIIVTAQLSSARGASNRSPRAQHHKLPDFGVVNEGWACSVGVGFDARHHTWGCQKRGVLLGGALLPDWSHGLIFLVIKIKKMSIWWDKTVMMINDYKQTTVHLSKFYVSKLLGLDIFPFLSLAITMAKYYMDCQYYLAQTKIHTEVNNERKWRGETLINRRGPK